MAVQQRTTLTALGVPRTVLREWVRSWLLEDVGTGDVTTQAIVSPDVRGQAEIVAREAGVLCGLPLVELVFHEVDDELDCTALVREGASVAAGTVVARIAGRLASILTGERLALNLLQRLSGIATTTRRFVEAIEGTGAVILDTRKTTPGLRALEKYAVRVGGGRNHRFGLFDGVLIKDNHIRAVGSVGDAVRRARERAPHPLAIEVEVTTLDELEEALEAGADWILLDNMDLETMREAVRRVAGRARLEASGGVTLERVRAIAETGVDAISVGALTHSVRALDIALEIVAIDSD
ncbi:carboxylating nicotinate-nucleotide diphosphorylase [Thermomicrobium sp. 4228-Ro]|uniref:carboxylating nicotinate-nucleotide diphosphorylase n=1 Tax=Thermomicrobium sp. 4228-Ro TaxID=2993937 RepID=UPI00224928EE|nr:carboxylating nicotinate-nucleotide diphosphorylase [Thermomicrobium sp. 4228-Ro]MCX2726282.1 carboxylating nicotinate-nucleotide diphosphorylase [Thermomicrobium sp. 4228-Ro]